jgi:hypothetical protein
VKSEKNRQLDKNRLREIPNTWRNQTRVLDKTGSPIVPPLYPSLKDNADSRSN